MLLDNKDILCITRKTPRPHKDRHAEVPPPRSVSRHSSPRGAVAAVRSTTRQGVWSAARDAVGEAAAAALTADRQSSDQGARDVTTPT